jgi:protease IV
MNLRNLRLVALFASGVIAAPALADDTNPFNPKKKPDDTKKADDKPLEKMPLDEKKPANKKDAKKDDTGVARIAHIKLSGGYDETPTESDSPFGSSSESLRTMLARIQKAADDSRVKALYLELGSVEVGFGKLNEIRRALSNFRATGKKIHAFAESLGTKSYLVALGCDTINLPESGGLELIGLRAEVMFYRDALKLLNLEADVLKMGKYKSAVEPFISDKMSAENREQVKSMMDDNFEKEIVAAMVAGRSGQKWTAAQAEAIIDQGPFTAKKAKQLGLIDNLNYQDELETGFAKLLDAESVKIERGYGKAKGKELDFSNPFAMLDMFSPKKKVDSKEPKIAVIHLIGGIDSGKGGVSPLSGSTIGSDTIVEAIREADKNPTVKAIVLRVDSPGGSALASDVIWRALKVCKKPVISSMGDVAASGGYYVTMNSKRVFAEPGTITGSIGVFGLKLVTGGLFDKFGLKTEIVSRGKNSGASSSHSKWSESERQALTETVEDVYETFLSKALAGRIANGQKLTMEQLKELAGGRVWTGRQAKANGLVDELGTLNDAIAYAKKEVGVDPSNEMELLLLPKPQTFIDKLMEGGLPFGLSIELKTIPGAEKALRGLAPVLGAEKDRLRMAMPFAIEFK